MPKRQRTGRSNENAAAVSASVGKDRKLSIPRRSKQLGLSVSPQRGGIYERGLDLHPYKIVLTLELKSFDLREPREFANFILKQFENDYDFFKKIIFPDELSFLV